MPCDISNLDDLVKGQERALVLLTTPECPFGNDMENLIKDNIDKFEKNRIKVIRINIDKEGCKDIADKMNIEYCPTLIFYEKEREIGRFSPSGQNKDEILNKLLYLKP